MMKKRIFYSNAAGIHLIAFFIQKENFLLIRIPFLGELPS